MMVKADPKALPADFIQSHSFGMHLSLYLAFSRSGCVPGLEACIRSQIVRLDFTSGVLLHGNDGHTAEHCCPHIGESCRI